MYLLSEQIIDRYESALVFNVLNIKWYHRYNSNNNPCFPSKPAGSIDGHMLITELVKV